MSGLPLTLTNRAEWHGRPNVGKTLNVSTYVLTKIDALLPTNLTLCLNVCVTLLKTAAMFLCFSFMAFYGFPTTVGQNSHCDVTIERSIGLLILKNREVFVLFSASFYFNCFVLRIKMTLYKMIITLSLFTRFLDCIYQ